MIRWFFHSLWFLTKATLVLCALVCFAEVGTRIFLQVNGYQSLEEASSRQQTMIVDSAVTGKSWLPAMQVSYANPDTQVAHIVQFNSFGFRGEEPVVPKPKEEFRILVLGDETVTGVSMPLSATFCSLMQEKLNHAPSAPSASSSVSSTSKPSQKIVVMNAGSPQFCPLLSAIQLRRIITQLQPDLVLYCFDMSDIADDYQVRHRVVFNDGGYPVVARQAKYSGQKQSPLQVLDDFVLGQYLKQKTIAYCQKDMLPESNSDIDSPKGKYAWLRHNSPDWSTYIRQAVEPVGQMQSLCQKMSVPFIMTSIPKPWQVSATACQGEGVRANVGIGQTTHCTSRVPFQMLNDFSASRQVTFFDPSARFAVAENKDQLFLHNAVELSEAGHQFVSQILSEYLLAQRASLRF